MQNIVPFFELNGIRYEIKKTRWLLAEYQKLQDQVSLSVEAKQNASKTERLLSDLKKYSEKVKELWEKYLETFDDEDERKYLKVKALYDKTHEQLTNFEAETESVEKVHKAGIDLLEKIAIKGLAEQNFNMDEQKAKSVWCEFVETVGNSVVTEWLSAMAECLFKGEEQENDFLSQMRKSAEEKAQNRRNGLKKMA
jgi:hypothetical protein